MKIAEINIDVNNLLSSEIGTSKNEKIISSISELDEFKITKPINIDLIITNLDETVMVDINTVVTLELVCDRCLKQFNSNVSLKYKEVFRLNPEIDEFSINSDQTIDLWPSIKQEVLLNFPIKKLCNQNCKGVLWQNQKNG